MRRNLRTCVAVSFGAAIVVGVAGAILVACQSHDFQRVEPKAIEVVSVSTTYAPQGKPAKVMLVIDRSTSMKSTVTSASYDEGCCTTQNGSTCTGYNAGGTCKWNTLLKRLNDKGGLLFPSDSSVAPVARFGLAVFPGFSVTESSSNACATGEVSVQVGSAPSQSDLASIVSRLSSQGPFGGTPSAATLKVVENDPSFQAESNVNRYVVLLTDGLPNCNSGLDRMNCLCTSFDTSKTPVCQTDSTNGALMCIDKTNLVSQIGSLASKGVKTFVVGVGDVLGDSRAVEVLNEAANAGGVPNPVGATKFYPVKEDTDFETVLQQIKVQIKMSCEIKLAETPEDPDLFQGILYNKDDNSETGLVKGTDWYFVDSEKTKVVIKEPLCSKLLNTSVTYDLKFLEARKFKENN